MGIRIDLKAANWLAYLIESDIPLPEFENPSNEKKILSAFFKTIVERFSFISLQRKRFNRTYK